MIVIFLFFATALNYVDRQTLSVLQTTIADFFKTDRSLDWVLPYSQYFYHSTFKVANADWAIKYAFIIFCFQTAYAIGYVLFGALIDKLGAKLGYSIAVVLWTAAHVACAMVTSLVGFSYMLFVLGLGQSGQLPRSPQSGCRMVSPARARTGQWRVQRRLEYRRDLHAAGRSDHHFVFRLAHGLRRHRQFECDLADLVDLDLQTPERRTNGYRPPNWPLSKATSPRRKINFPG